MKKAAAMLATVMALVMIISTESCQSTKSGTVSKMLRFNYEAGKGYDYEMNMELNQLIMGQQVPMGILYYYSMDVAPGSEGSKAITTTFERLKMDMTFGAYSMVIDSDEPEKGTEDEDNPLAGPMKQFGSVLRAMKGMKFVMMVDPNGEVKEVTGFDGIASALADSLGLPEEKKAEMMKRFKERFNNEEMTNQFAQVLYILPNKEVKVGDTWEREYGSGQQLGNGKFISTYAVKEIEGDMVTLEEKSTLVEGTGPQRMKGKKSGLIVVDSKTGLVVDADNELDLTANMDGTAVEIKGAIKIKGKARN